MDAINELAGALAKAQGELKNPAFDSTNPHFRNKFASLAAVRNAVIPILAKHGLSVVQNLTTTDSGIGCETILLHCSGQSLRLGPLVLPATKADAQGFGSAATYARRYSLMAVAGVVGDDDDDAEAATQGKTTQQAIAKRGAETKAANEYSKRILSALEQGMDSAAGDIMREAKDVSEEFAISVWHTFPKSVQDKLRDISHKEAA